MPGYHSEFVIALTCAVGTDILPVREAIEEELQKYGYSCNTVKISNDLLAPLDANLPEKGYARSDRLMSLGNEMRGSSGDNGILAQGAIHQITVHRGKADEPRQSTAYIVDSLKNPEEVKVLRKVYSPASISSPSTRPITSDWTTSSRRICPEATPCVLWHATWTRGRSTARRPARCLSWRISTSR